MDHAGKDTYNARASGAKAISIGNENSWATIQDRPMSMIDQKLLALDYDFALIEGHKYSKAAKIVFTNDQFNLKAEILEGKITEIIAIIGDQNLALELNLPYFHRDESDKIAQFVLDYFLKIYQAMPINGMALIGGKSTRMGQDKSKLVYHDKIQAEHLLDILGQHCEKVYYSGRSDQALDPSFSKYDFIKDQFLDLAQAQASSAISNAIPTLVYSFVLVICLTLTKHQ
jgi:molybdopterin-guanine dinucleotide biosynthesis protein MobB